MKSLQGRCWTPTFWHSKKKKGKKRKKKIMSLKAETLKSCHQGQNVTGLAILEGLKFKYFSWRQYCSVFHGLSSLKSISPALKWKQRRIYNPSEHLWWSLWIYLTPYYFCNKAPSQMFDWVICRLPEILKFWIEVRLRWSISSRLLQHVASL